jgi:hypothetical protein
MVVIFTDHTKRGIWSRPNRARRYLPVVMKLIEARIDLAPARWREKITRSTDGPEWAMLLDRGGYRVHPVPAPFSTAAEIMRSNRAGGRSQNLMLFIRGKAISGAASMSGTSQFPKPPIRTGITRKKIISTPWAVTIVLYSWSVPSREPGWPSSARMRRLIEVPRRPDQIPSMKYIVPISLWLVENNHRAGFSGGRLEVDWVNMFLRTVECIM